MDKTFQELRDKLLAKKAERRDCFYACPRCDEKNKFSLLDFEDPVGAICSKHGVVILNDQAHWRK